MKPEFNLLDVVQVTKPDSQFAGMRGVVSSYGCCPPMYMVEFNNPTDEFTAWDFPAKSLKLIKPYWWRKLWWSKFPPRWIRNHRVAPGLK